MSKYIKYPFKFSRRIKIALQLGADSSLVVLSFFIAMLLRLENVAFIRQLEVYAVLLIAVIAALVAFELLGVYRVLVRYINGAILYSVGKGALISAFALYVAGIIFDANLPQSAPIIFAIFVFLSVGGLRFFTRALLRNPSLIHKRPVIIYGAGEAVGSSLMH